MHTGFVAPFQLIHKNGWSEEFFDLVSLAVVLRETRMRISEVFGSNDWIVRDNWGATVSHDAILAAAPWLRRDSRHAAVKHAAALGLPIPYTGIGRSGYGKGFRTMRTLRSNRARESMRVDDRESDVIPKGKIAWLPTSWDDHCRASLYDRNWKNFRKTRWK